mmetsp:Transcript_17396/g.26094  ORF Transcript_17396/g.26094 Transcript_17396/m.26094 type:complete len:182 (+) Transcript_17396:269-814(+)
MGSDHSKPETRYKRELLKLSWRVVLTIQQDADEASKSQSASVASGVTPLDGKSVKSSSLKSDHVVQPFHVDFMSQFFKYCPDLAKKFPSDYNLVSKMIQSFISTAINSDAKKFQSLANRFGKTHTKYNLQKEHFEGFAEALCDTIQSRLGKFGTIELVRIWRTVTETIVKDMQKAYAVAKK